MNVLLPYQKKFLNNKAKIKIWRKSRRIGATYAVAYNSCLTAARSKAPWNVWASSADMQAAKEFMRDCALWAERLNKVAKELGEVILNDEKDITALAIEFATKKRIFALSSSPRNFRSKGGSVILDEFAFHEQARELWKAATPVIRWGGDILVLSSVSTEDNFFEELCDKAKKDQTGTYYFQQTTLIDAVDDGLVDKILKKKATLKEKDKFIDEIREECLLEEVFLQEYMCVPSSNDGEYWLPWELITGVESRDITTDGSNYRGGKTVIGHDIAIRSDRITYSVFEQVGDVFHLVELKVLSNKGRSKSNKVTFEEQERVMQELVAKYNPYRIMVDQTGMGEPMVERYQKYFGSQRVVGVIFNLSSKQELAVNAKQMFEDKKLRLPFNNEQIRNDLRKVKRVAGVGNIPKFDAVRDKQGHADIWWCIALALLAGKTGYQPLDYRAVRDKERLSIKRIKGGW